MEDIFESILALLVIVIPLLLKKKKEKQEKPGSGRTASTPKKPAHAAPKHDPDALKHTLAEVEKKLDAWIEQLEDDDTPDAAAEPSALQPEYLQPEPLVPERLQESGMSEGQSHIDEFGCLGGSLPHEADEHHQGEDFHAQGTHGHRTAQRARQEEPLRVERVKPAVSAADLRKAVIWKEILDKPVSIRE